MSRRRRNGLFVLCIAILLTAVWLDRQHGAGLRKEIAQRAKWGVDGWKYHGKTFTVDVRLVSYEVLGQNGNLTRFTAELLPTGEGAWTG